ncbi:MAG: phosphotransferase enzyme family protein [Mycobacteriales bacterium]
MTEDLQTRAAGSDELVAEVAERYGLGACATWVDLGGSWTTNLRLDLAERVLVARIHQGSTPPERLAAVQAAREAVATAGIPTVTPIRVADGSGFVALSSGRLVELEPFLTWDTRMNTSALITRGHGVLAAMHDALRSADLPSAAGTVRYANYIDSMGALDASRRGVARIRGWGDAKLSDFADVALTHVESVAELESALRDRQLTQIVHGDFWDNNVLFRGTELVAVIDFDFMARRPRVDDLALTAYFLFLQPGRGLPTRDDAAMLRRFTDAYDAVAGVPLAIDERAALPLAIARQPAWSLGRWVVELDEGGARKHATDLMGELPVARAILADIDYWQHALIG